jgi:peptide deformylase
MEEGWEGCLSVPGLRGLVPRWQHLRYTGFDPYGRRSSARSKVSTPRRPARVRSPGRDSLPERIRDFRSFGFTEELFPDAAFAPDD